MDEYLICYYFADINNHHGIGKHYLKTFNKLTEKLINMWEEEMLKLFNGRYKSIMVINVVKLDGDE